MKKIYFLFFLLPFMFFLTVEESEAQWGIGASYELRDEEPRNGLGVRIEREMFGMIPIVDISMRAHFSYFSENVNRDDPQGSVSGDFETYDFGLAAVGGIGIGLLKPYVGTGLGIDNTSFDDRDDADSFEDTDFYWNAFVGAEITMLPFLSPFLEYRFSKIGGRDDISPDTINRIAFGVSLRF